MIIASPRIMLFHFSFRTLYDKLKATLRKPIHDLIGPHNYRQNGIESNGKFYEQNLQQIANANTTINRFLSAFIDHVIFSYALR